MKAIENKKIEETVYEERLENGLEVMIIPKKNTQKKYIIWGTNYGSNDNKFFVKGDKDVTEVPNGVAHYLEHKLFEQKNGRNSLDVLTSLGVNANAYTTNEYTAYLFECTKNFYEALDEFMDYVQNPYFTDENVEKERGIISQEIGMYDDSPEWRVYLNCMKAMYHKNSIKIDIAGTVETIKQIDKDILYKCYNSFYQPKNMALVVAGDFEPEEILKEIKSRIVKKKEQIEVERIFEEENQEIVKPYIEEEFDITQPIFVIGLKDEREKEDIVKKHIIIDILLNIIVGKSSDLYHELYKKGLVKDYISSNYEFGRNFAHILISGQSKDPNMVLQLLKEKIAKIKEKGISTEEFERSKKKLYGSYVRDFDEIDDISRMFLADYFQGINSFEYIEKIKDIEISEVEETLKKVFDEEKMVISIVKK